MLYASKDFGRSFAFRGLIGGVAGEFYSRCAAAYGTTAPPHYDHEPHVASEAFAALLANASGVRLLRGGHGANVRRATKHGLAIASIELADGRTVVGKAFVDASYEGDLLAASTSAAAWTVGRESVAQYNESGAGRRPNDFNRAYQFKVRPTPLTTSSPPPGVAAATSGAGTAAAAADTATAAGRPHKNGRVAAAVAGA